MKKKLLLVVAMLCMVSMTANFSMAGTTSLSNSTKVIAIYDEKEILDDGMEEASSGVLQTNAFTRSIGDFVINFHDIDIVRYANLVFAQAGTEVIDGNGGNELWNIYASGVLYKNGSLNRRLSTASVKGVYSGFAETDNSDYSGSTGDYYALIALSTL